MYEVSDERFIIDCYGIIDTWRKTNTGKCEDDRLSWTDLCDTLNSLNHMCDEELDEYKYIVELEEENQKLKLKLVSISAFIVKARQNMQDIDEVINKDF